MKKFLIMYFSIIFILFIVAIAYDYSKKIDIYYHEDKTLKEDFNDIYKLKFDKKISNTFSMGYKKSSIWLKLEINNLGKNIILDLNEHLYDEVTLYYFDKKDNLITQKESNMTPIADRIIPSNKIAFKLTNLQNNKPIYLNIKSKLSIIGKVNIYNYRDYYIQNMINYNIIIVIFLFILFTLIIFSLFLIYKYKKKIFIYFSFLCIFYALYLLDNSGLFIYFNLEKFKYIFHRSSIFCIIFLILFSIEYLKINKYLTSIYSILKAIVVLLIIMFILSFEMSSLIFQLDGTIALFSLFLIIYSSYNILNITGNYDILCFILSNSFVFISLVFYELLLFGFIEYNDIIRNALIFALLLQILTFSFLLFRYIVEKEKEKITEKIDFYNKQMLELNHRIKNNLHFLISVLSLESKKNENQSKLYLDLISRINTISLLHENLYNQKKHNLNLYKYLTTIIDNVKKIYQDSNKILIKQIIDDKINLNYVHSLCVGIIVNELLTNSLKHNKKIDNFEILIKLISNGTRKIELMIKDNGVGFNCHQNFDSLGLQIIKDFCNKLESCKYDIISDKGTTFKFTFLNPKENI